MGANTLKAAGIMDDTFYEAFGEYNSRAEKPLYLLQGILVQDSVNLVRATHMTMILWIP